MTLKPEDIPIVRAFGEAITASAKWRHEHPMGSEVSIETKGVNQDGGGLVLQHIELRMTFRQHAIRHNVAIEMLVACKVPWSHIFTSSIDDLFTKIEEKADA